MDAGAAAGFGRIHLSRLCRPEGVIATCAGSGRPGGRAPTCTGAFPALVFEQSIMSRTATITNERLLQAAQAEFLDRGIRATSVAIARRAGVSPGILFHRFGSKEALFAAAMNLGSDAGRPFDLMSRVGKGSVQETLVELGELLLDRFFVVVPSQLMAWANPGPGRVPAGAGRPRKTAAGRGGANPAEQFRFSGVRGQRQLAEYLRAEARQKRIRAVDPFVVAQTFSGALWFFAFEQVSGAKLRRTDEPPSRSEFVRRLVDTLWRGLQP